MTAWKRWCTQKFSKRTTTGPWVTMTRKTKVSNFPTPEVGHQRQAAMIQTTIPPEMICPMVITPMVRNIFPIKCIHHTISPKKQQQKM